MATGAAGVPGADIADGLMTAASARIATLTSRPRRRRSLEPAHSPAQSLGSDMSVSGTHARITMAERGHDNREPSTLTSQTSSHVVAEVVEMEIPVAQSGNKSLEGTPDRRTVELGKNESTWLWGKCTQCRQECWVERDGMCVSVLCGRKCQYHGFYVYVPPSQADERREPAGGIATREYVEPEDGVGLGEEFLALSVGQPLNPALGGLEFVDAGRGISRQEAPADPGPQTMTHAGKVAVSGGWLTLCAKYAPPRFDMLGAELMKEPRPECVGEPGKDGFLSSYGCLSETGLDDRPVAVMHEPCQAQ